jgi:hypothetical protein
MNEEPRPQLPVEPPEPELPAPSFWEKLKANKLKILGGVLGILVFAGALLGAYKLGQRQAQPAPQPTPTPAAVTTPTPDPTADWQAYTNTEHGYSIKYPLNWNLQEVAPGGLGVEISSFDTAKPVDDETGKGIFSVHISENFSPISVKEWLLEETRRCKKEGGCAPSPPEILEEVSIDDQPGVKTDNPLPGILSGMGISYFVSHDRRLYEIRFQFGLNEVEGGEISNTFNLILSTFRFLNSEDLGVWIEDWQEYANDVYHYSFKYPPAFSLVDRSVVGKNQVEVSRNNEKIIVRAGEEKETPYYLDAESSGETELGGMAAKIYKFPDGHCDGLSCSPSFIAIVVYKGSNQYALEFYQTTEVSGLYQQILSTFKFLD